MFPNAVLLGQPTAAIGDVEGEREDTSSSILWIEILYQ